MRAPPLRHRPVPEILEELGLDDDDPRCPVDGWPIRVHPDPCAGTSLRCGRDRCPHAAWAWPEHVRDDFGDVLRPSRRPDRDDAPQGRAAAVVKAWLRRAS